MRKKLNRDFYLRDNVVEIARDLLGKHLYTRVRGKISSGMIVETEAYSGSVERASHAFQNKLTPRTKVMFENGGIAYVYLCYGIHKLFNVVTNVKGKPDAILIRAIEPVEGTRHILRRRNSEKLIPGLSSGPGKVAASLAIDLQHNSQPLTGDRVWIEDHRINGLEIVETTRVGVEYAGKDALLPWRFYIKDNLWVSKK